MKISQKILLVFAILTIGLVTPMVEEKSWSTVFGKLFFPTLLEVLAFIAISTAVSVLIVFFDLLSELKKTVLATFVASATVFTALAKIFFVGLAIGIIVSMIMYIFTWMINSSFDKKIEKGIKKMEDYVKNNFPNFTRWLVKTDNFLEKYM